MNNSFYRPHDNEASAFKVSPTPEEMIKSIKDSEVEEGKKRDSAMVSNTSRKESERGKIK
jgi:hypothetical protein